MYKFVWILLLAILCQNSFESIASCPDKSFLGVWEFEVSGPQELQFDGIDCTAANYPTENKVIRKIELQPTGLAIDVERKYYGTWFSNYAHGVIIRINEEEFTINVKATIDATTIISKCDQIDEMDSYLTKTVVTSKIFSCLKGSNVNPLYPIDEMQSHTSNRIYNGVSYDIYNSANYDISNEDIDYLKEEEFSSKEFISWSVFDDDHKYGKDGSIYSAPLQAMMLQYAYQTKDSDITLSSENLVECVNKPRSPFDIYQYVNKYGIYDDAVYFGFEERGEPSKCRSNAKRTDGKYYFSAPRSLSLKPGQVSSDTKSIKSEIYKNGATTASIKVDNDDRFKYCKTTNIPQYWENTFEYKKLENNDITDNVRINALSEEEYKKQNNIGNNNKQSFINYAQKNFTNDKLIVSDMLRLYDDSIIATTIATTVYDAQDILISRNNGSGWAQFNFDETANKNTYSLATNDNVIIASHGNEDTPTLYISTNGFEWSIILPTSDIQNLIEEKPSAIYSIVYHKQLQKFIAFVGCTTCNKSIIESVDGKKWVSSQLNTNVKGRIRNAYYDEKTAELFVTVSECANSIDCGLYALRKNAAFFENLKAGEKVIAYTSSLEKDGSKAMFITAFVPSVGDEDKYIAAAKRANDILTITTQGDHKLEIGDFVTIAFGKTNTMFTSIINAKVEKKTLNTIDVKQTGVPIELKTITDSKVYSSIGTAKIYKSIDNGKTWKEVYSNQVSGMPNDSIFNLYAFADLTGGIMYTSIAKFEDEERLSSITGKSTILKSEDYGNTWNEADSNESYNKVAKNTYFLTTMRNAKGTLLIGSEGAIIEVTKFDIPKEKKIYDINHSVTLTGWKRNYYQNVSTEDYLYVDFWEVLNSNGDSWCNGGSSYVRMNYNDFALESNVDSFRYYEDPVVPADARDLQIEKLEKDLSETKEKLAADEAEIINKNQTIQEQDSKIQELEAKNTDQKNTINQQAADIEKKAKQIEEDTKRIKDTDSKLIQVQTELKEELESSRTDGGTIAALAIFFVLFFAASVVFIVFFVIYYKKATSSPSATKHFARPTNYTTLHTSATPTVVSRPSTIKPEVAVKTVNATPVVSTSIKPKPLNNNEIEEEDLLSSHYQNDAYM